ncbi:MAG: 16S rRNA (cytosine(967)-C(5))-methyltransferase [Candidatus Contendobacter odensis]|uniref:16S rRNA (cytosine(967)-C(5))-methyltransferase n=1 Tax=Candidatus Contendibacter odensensis TaxID=1400860 RepID=A0A2G6PEF2_9GAMM|nr:MAG: 16S rRNA (cytosine(967)-C(5))-methyltransferase [Candidatus Contendobacter odensis]
MNTRAIAAQILGQVLGEGKSLAEALPSGLNRSPSRDHGLLQELCYGVCRWHPQLQALLNQLLVRPLAPTEQTVRALLLIGLYQIWHLRIPQHAAVAETVAATRPLNKSWATKLCNAILRNSVRRHDELNHAIKTDQVAQTSHPRWLLDRLRQDWSDDWETIVAANNAYPPLTLRINQRHLGREAYQQHLAATDHHSVPVAGVPTALTLTKAIDIKRLPNFTEGWVSVQDAAAQWAAPLLDAAPQMNVLDACAAPGGKTGHLLEHTPDLNMTALDCSATRLEQVRDNLSRLRLQQTVRLIAGDARQPEAWWDGHLFDRILVDAPCSATGVIRRHPDIKLLRREADIAILAKQQRAILASLWPLLKPGGRLLYVTCSVLHTENEQVIATFLAAHPDAKVDTKAQGIMADYSHTMLYGRQILPGEHGMDGLYYADLVKNASAGETT